MLLGGGERMGRQPEGCVEGGLERQGAMPEPLLDKLGRGESTEVTIRALPPETTLLRRKTHVVPPCV